MAEVSKETVTLQPQGSEANRLCFIKLVHKVWNTTINYWKYVILRFSSWKSEWN